MTSHYAKAHDTTAREQWEWSRAINSNGDPVDVATDSAMAEAVRSQLSTDRAPGTPPERVLPNGIGALMRRWLYCTSSLPQLTTS